MALVRTYAVWAQALTVVCQSATVMAMAVAMGIRAPSQHDDRNSEEPDTDPPTPVDLIQIAVTDCLESLKIERFHIQRQTS